MDSAAADISLGAVVIHPSSRRKSNMQSNKFHETGKEIGRAASYRPNRLIAGAIAVALIAVIASAYQENRQRRIRMEKGIADSAKIAADAERKREAAQEAQAAANSQPEIRIADFILQPRSRIESVLGKPVKSSECTDTTGWQYEYGDGSYLCVDHGRVILLSYRLRRVPSNFNDALSAVGLHTTVQPFAPYGSLLNVWSAERGNRSEEHTSELQSQ